MALDVIGEAAAVFATTLPLAASVIAGFAWLIARQDALHRENIRLVEVNAARLEQRIQDLERSLRRRTIE